MLSIPGVMMMFMVCFVEEMSIIASMTMLSLWLTDTVSIVYKCLQSLYVYNVYKLL